MVLARSIHLAVALGVVAAATLSATSANAQPNLDARCRVTAAGLHCFVRNSGSHAGTCGLEVSVQRSDYPGVAWSGTTTYGEVPEIPPGQEVEIPIDFAPMASDGNNADAGPGTRAQQISEYCLGGPTHAYADCRIEVGVDMVQDTSVVAGVAQWAPLVAPFLLLLAATLWVWRDANALGGSGAAWAAGVFFFCGIALPIYLLFGRRKLKATRDALRRMASDGSPPPP